MYTFEEDIERVLLTAEEISAKVQEMGAAISRDYQGKDLLMISVLKGSVVFMADLMRALSIPASIDFLAVSSYGQSAVSNGVVKIVKDIDIDLAGKDLLIVEDILDSGKTLSHLMELLGTRAPQSIRIATLLDKPLRRTVEVKAHYTGFEVPDEFLVGYGLDYAERYRGLPYVAVLKREVYTPAG